MCLSRHADKSSLPCVCVWSPASCSQHSVCPLELCSSSNWLHYANDSIKLRTWLFKLSCQQRLLILTFLNSSMRRHFSSPFLSFSLSLLFLSFFLKATTLFNLLQCYSLPLVTQLSLASNNSSRSCIAINIFYSWSGSWSSSAGCSNPQLVWKPFLSTLFSRCCPKRMCL